MKITFDLEIPEDKKDAVLDGAARIHGWIEEMGMTSCDFMHSKFMEMIVAGYRSYEGRKAAEAASSIAIKEAEQVNIQKG